MDLAHVLQANFGIESVNIRLPLEQRLVQLPGPDGTTKTVELPETLRFDALVTKRDGNALECIDALGNRFRVSE